MTMVATGAFAVTPNDSTDLTTPARALYVGGAGNIALVCTRGGPTVSFVGVAAGTVLPVFTYRVLATGTSATNIVALL